MDIKTIPEISAVAIPPLILCSCIRLVTYYSHWNIPILDYLTSSELLFSFVHPGLIFLALAAIYFAAMVIFVGVVFFLIKAGLIPEKGMKGPEEESGQTNARVEQEKSGKFQKVSWLAIVGFIGYAIWLLFSGIWYEYDPVPAVIFHVVLLLAAIATVHRASESTEKRASLGSILVGTLITLMSASFFYGHFQIHNTSTHPVPYSITLTDNSIIQTTNTLIYLGKTTDYYFLYDSAGNQATIVPAGEVKTIGIRATQDGGK